MENNLISIEDICSFHHVEINFIRSLEEFGLVQTTIIKKAVFLNTEELDKLERCIRLSKDLEINLEGIHAVAQLLSQLNKMQNEVIQLKNELNYYHQIH
ncbi:chaperone modulator CbpM [Pedobacter fastidiosus]|uniref:MerR family transcriptional regulator n=1 Tax=Pedobacter fastidiosus TaxID=2765361 RepID=A0ABR7KU66_9SPHI|nr:chaperone modulator CbpM [Pedobacter fastidiosus]MBC6111630.1 MerR family transcriptional regulator [Pedobacter fastidiosus]